MTALASPHELPIALNTVQFLLSPINHRYLIRCVEIQHNYVIKMIQRYGLSKLSLMLQESVFTYLCHNKS